MLKVLSLAFLLLFPSIAPGQHQGDYFISNFNRSDYGGSFANFGVVQADNGLIYVANYDGVLEYDGNQWRLYPVANNSVVFSIAQFKGTIYVGAQKEFGCFEPDSLGNLVYTSLSSRVPPSVTFNSIRGVVPASDGIYFFSNEAIFHLNDRGEVLEIWESKDNKFYFSLFPINGKRYCLRENYGLIELSNNREGLIATPSVRSWRVMTFMDQIRSSVVIGTLTQGLHEWQGMESKRLLNPVSEFSMANQLSVGRRYDGYKYAFGTFKGGIAVSNDEFEILSVIDQEHGLQSNHVKDLNFDAHGGLWVAMQEGVARVDVNSPWTYWDRESDFKGVPWDLIKSNGTLYIATTEGLYYQNGSSFKEVEGIENKVWSLCNIASNNGERQVLLAGTSAGLYEVREGRSTGISNFPIITKLSRSRNMYPDSIAVVGHRYGLSIVGHDKNGAYIRRDLTEILNNTYEDIVLDDSMNVWATSKFVGVYRISDITSPAPRVELFTARHGISDVSQLNVFFQDGDILLTGTSDTYRFDPGASVDSLLFKKDTLFTMSTGHSELLSDEPVHTGVSVNSLNLVEEWMPMRILPDMEITEVYPDDDQILWIAGSEGLFRFDGKIEKDYTIPFNTLIRKVTTSDSLIFNGAGPISHFHAENGVTGISQMAEYPPELTYDFNNMRFEFAATSYELPEQNRYSYYLENNDRQWSSWTYESRKEYNNLPPGGYTFYVKSKNLYDVEGKTAFYSFVILPPWYKTNWAYGIYVIFGAFGIWLIALGYSYRVRMQRRRLKLIVADRTFEVISQKKEIENQNELLRMQNDEISRQKEDIESKNIQLSDSQEKILTINEELTELNQSLERKIEDRTSKIKATLKRLQEINKELDTFIYRASHDLKGPISRIHGLTALAKLQTLDNTNARYYDLIEDTTREMEMLLSKLIQVHEILNLEVSKEEVDIPSLLHEIRESIKFLDKDQDIQYSFDLDSHISLITDKYLITIIFKNLIDNALTFRKTPNKGPHKVNIITHRSNNTFEFRVFDNGIGIDPAHYDKIYEMFFKGSDLSRGNGLGLYLVKLASDKLGATVEMNSKEGVFTEFMVRIPI